VPPLDCPNHQLVSLVGNIAADGSASLFDTVGRLADLTKARHYPTPLPFLMGSEAERAQLLRIDPIVRVRALAARADLRLVGIGQMDRKAQVHVDGFIDREELLVSDLDLTQIDREKMTFDVSGHYARPDLFRFERKNTDAKWEDESS